MLNLFRRRFIILLIAALTLSACESAEEKAERYYESGIRLMEVGDKDRALVEFRNVFKYNGLHKEARKIYAKILMEQGDTNEAVRHYLRLIEQYPDTLEVRYILAEVAFENRSWDEVERHGAAASLLSPTASRSRAIVLALDYRKAGIDKDQPALQKIASEAQALSKEIPDNRILVRLVVNHLQNSSTPLDALPVIEATLARNNLQFDMHLEKFRILAAQDNIEAVGEQLKLMFKLFPEKEEIKTPLIGWFLVKGDLVGAEAFMREIAGDPVENPAGHMAIVQFLLATNGWEAAKAELAKLVAQTEGDARNEYRRLDATLDFQNGRPDLAISTLQDMLIAGGPQNEAKSLLAKILNKQGDVDGSRTLVEKILAQDPSNVDALKLRASWLIQQDETGAAIADLRNALNQAPRDPDTLTLMALAHEREGNLDLASERLALAVEVSGSGVKQSLYYASFLISQGRTSVANAVLVDSLAKSPNNLKILSALAKSYLLQKDWVRAQNIAKRLRELADPAANRVAQNLQAAILTGQNRLEDSLSSLQNQMMSDTSSSEKVRAAIMIAHTQIRLNRIEAARAFMDEQLEQWPDNADLLFLSAGISALSGDLGAAETEYKHLIDLHPKSFLPVRMLLGILLGSGRDADMETELAKAMVRMPENRELKLIKAELLEKSGDIDATILIYEDLYASDSSNNLVANNLASLLSTHQQDAQRIERAFIITRRFRTSDVPQFQDTFGWIEYLRGDPAAGLPHLIAASEALPNDPTIHFHLGIVYAALDRADAARKHLEKALEIFGDNDTPQAIEARKKLATLL